MMTKTNETLRRTEDILLFLAVFFLMQLAATYGVRLVSQWLGGTAGVSGMSGKQLVTGSVVASVLTMGVFVRLRWSPVSRHWLSLHPWATLIWVTLLALGTILPSQWIDDQMQLTMPETFVRLFEAVMGEPAGYLALGILAPIAEELVFRGAVLRTLLRMFGDRAHWLPIAISAVVFGAVHGNLPQFVHAALLGLLLGWLYYRTHSVVPGIVLHWVNNTVAYVMFNLMPQMADGKLIDLFHGDARTMWLGIGFSLCIFVPSLLQLNAKLRRE